MPIYLPKLTNFTIERNHLNSITKIQKFLIKFILT